MNEEARKAKEAEEKARAEKEEAEKAEREKATAAAEAEKNAKEGAKDTKKDTSTKPIPRPPPLPTCWPPQVVDGKNVGGDGPIGINMANVLGGGRGGGGRGDMLGALLGGRGGGRGGPLAFLRRKSGGNFKPMGPKLKQLHWDTLDATEGTLWEDKSSAGNGLVSRSELLSAC